MNDGGVKVYFGGDTTQLKSAFTEANQMAQEFHHSLAQAGLGAGRAFGFGFLIKEIKHYITEVIDEAQKTRDEFDKWGKPLDATTRQLAEVGDQMDELKHTITAATGEIVVFADKGFKGLAMIDEIAKRGGKNLFEALISGDPAKAMSAFSDAVTQLARDYKSTDESARALKQTEREIEEARKKNSPEKIAEAEKKLGEERKKTAMEQTDDEGKINILLEEQVQLQQLVNTTGEHSLVGAQARIDLERNVVALGKVRFHQAEEQQKKEKEQGDQAVKDYKEEVRLQKELHDLKFASLAPDQQVVQLEHELAEITIKIAKAKRDGVDTLQLEIDQQKISNELEKVKLEIIDRQKKSKAEIAAAEKARLEAEKNAIISIVGIAGGKQFNDASDATLAEVSRRNRSRAASLRQSDTMANPGGGPSVGNSLEEARLEAEATNAEQEIKFRRNFRSTVQNQGVEAARRSFQGDPLQFDRILQQLTSGLTVADKQLTEAEKTNRLLAGRFVNQ